MAAPLSGAICHGFARERRNVDPHLAVIGHGLQLRRGEVVELVAGREVRPGRPAHRRRCRGCGGDGGRHQCMPRSPSNSRTRLCSEAICAMVLFAAGDEADRGSPACSPVCAGGARSSGDVPTHGPAAARAPGSARRLARRRHVGRAGGPDTRTLPLIDGDQHGAGEAARAAAGDERLHHGTTSTRSRFPVTKMSAPGGRDLDGRRLDAGRRHRAALRDAGGADAADDQRRTTLPRPPPRPGCRRKPWRARLPPASLPKRRRRAGAGTRPAAAQAARAPSARYRRGLRRAARTRSANPAAAPLSGHCWSRSSMEVLQRRAQRIPGARDARLHRASSTCSTAAISS